MKKKIKNNTGFTLAELLIVVAIIAVLVAIAIPIFTTQLEKSREATDLANVRSAYAEVMMAAITGDASATYTGDSNQKIYKSDSGTYSVIVQPLKQKKDNWQMPTPITIGGVSSNAGDTYWRGVPGAGGYCEITYHPAAGSTGEYVSFYWTGGSDSGNSGNNGNSDPTPTVTPGANSGNSSDDWYNSFKTSTTPYPTGEFEGKLGQIYSYKDELYVCISRETYKANGSPSAEENGWYQWNFIKISKATTVLSSKDLKPKNEWRPNELELQDLKRGDIYFDGSSYYIIKTNASHQDAPDSATGTSGNWIKVQLSN